MILPVGYHAPRLDAPARPLCRTKRLHQIATTFRAVDCENCLYLADIQARTQELVACYNFGDAAVLAIRYGEAVEDVVALAEVSAHFAIRLLESEAS